MAIPVQTVLEQLAQSVIGGVDNVVYALIVLVIGYIIGKISAAVVVKALQEAKVDKRLKYTHLKFTVSSVTATVVKWVVYLVFLQQAAAILSIAVISSVVDQIIAFIPGIAKAAIILLAADAIGIYLKYDVIGAKQAATKLVGDLVFAIVLYVGIATALPQVGISAELINQMLLLMVGALALGVAIALGLGLRSAVEGVAKDYVKLRKR